MKKISDAKRTTIISLLGDGLSSRQIASWLKISHSTVDKIRAVHHPTIQKTKGGRKPRLTAAAVRVSGKCEQIRIICFKVGIVEFNLNTLTFLFLGFWLAIKLFDM